MTDTRVEEIEVHHKPREYRSPTEDRTHAVCDRCTSPWPCDAAYLLTQLGDREAKLAAVRLAAIKSRSDGWTDCMLCGTTWRTDVDQEHHTDCSLTPKGAE